MKLIDRLMSSAALVAVISSDGIAWAASPEGPAKTGAEGAALPSIVVTAEKYQAAAPSNASLLETQPQSIITHQFLEQSTPETGDYTTAILIAPSVAGVSSNGGGVGDSNTSTLRGFQDGQYNVTYDGIAFGDTNDLSHHPAAFFPGSTIGAVVVDRGPGAAGDLGLANFGGAIHLFSPTVKDDFGASQKVTYGSFNTRSYVTTLQTGTIDALYGTKIMLNFDERSSDGELSYSSGVGYEQSMKFVTPVNDRLVLTGFATFNYIQYYQADTGAALGEGVTPQQLAAYGKNFALNNDPFDEHYYQFNQPKKHTRFAYLDAKWNAGNGLTVENQLYDYYYKNTKVSVLNVNDLVSTVPGPVISPSSATVNGTRPTDIGGYDQLNRYHNFGDIVRVNKDLGFGTLRAGGLVEWSRTYRYQLNYDFTTNLPDYGNPGGAAGNATYNEYSSWFQYQMFADFEIRPTDRLTVTPGIKWVDFTRRIDASIESDGLPSRGSKEYSKPLYFLTGNYRLTDNWSAYAQTASSFLIPPIKTLETPKGTTENTVPQQTWTYQAGTVYTLGPITLDADYYHIRASNVLVNRSATPCQCYLNAGSGVYSGVEVQGAYSVGYGVTAFANGSVNNARNTNPGNGSAPMDFTNAPRGTAAYGLLYNHGPWMASLSDKLVGSQMGSDGVTRLKAYDTIDGSVSYDFGKLKLKLAGFNLADKRAMLDFDGVYYAYQVGRQIQGTVEAKF